MSDFTELDITQPMIQAGRYAANLNDGTLARIYLAMRAAEQGGGSDPRTDPLRAVCRAFIEKQRVSCPEATIEDRVYENAPELVEQIGKIVGFYSYPDEDED